MAKAKKKVLFTSHTANFVKFNRPFMRMLKARGYEVHYASAGEEHVPDCDVHHTIPFERSPLKLDNLKAYRRLKRIIDQERFELIHTHTPMGSVVTRLAARDARKRGTRVIYTAHGFHFFKGAPLANWLIYYPIEKVMARFTDTLVTINHEDYVRALAKFATDTRYVAGVGIESEKFDVPMTEKEKRELRKSIGVADDDFVLLYIAELNHNKNQAMLLRAIAQIKSSTPNLRLLLAGFDSLNGATQQLAKELGIEKNVIFLGYRRDIPYLIQLADVAVSASRREGLPVNIMEAMYVGLPVVATACRGNSDLTSDGKNGFLVAQDDNEAAAFAIAKLYGDEDLRKQFGAASRKLVKPYMMESVMREMVEIYGK